MAERRAVLKSPEHHLRWACAELGRRLRAGESCAAEDYLRAEPDLSDHPDYALELIYTEYVVREELGQQPSAEEWPARFPEYRERLERLLQVHEGLRLEPPTDPAFGPDTPPPSGDALGGPSPGLHLDGYEVLEEVGRGGMGVVYKARQAGLNRLVALKMILAGGHAGPEQRTRFRTEAEAAARLQHAHIVQVYEVGERDGYPYLAQEYVEGESLARRLGRGPLPAREAARLVESLARAVHHAHQRGVLHRDLKPANVLLAGVRSEDRGSSPTSPLDPHSSLLAAVPKIIDFGLAKQLMDGPAGPTRTGAVLGTPGYMAPEQAAGRPDAVGTGADVYGLGAVFYECLTGRPPFRGETDLDTLQMVLEVEPVPPRRLRPNCPRDLETICLKCLHKSPRQRYESAEALADDLGRFIGGEPIRARAAGASEYLVKWVRRRPAVAALLAVLVVSGFCSLATVTVLWRRTVAALEDADGQRHRAEADASAKTIALAHRLWLSAELGSAREQLRQVPAAHRDREWRYLDRVCNAELVCLRDEPKRLHHVRFSPDGRRLLTLELFMTRSKTPLAVWDLATGRKTFNPPVGASEHVDAAFTSAGRHVILLSTTPFPVRGASPPAPADAARAAVVTFDVETGQEVRRLDRTDTGEELGPLERTTTLSPGARRFAAVDHRTQTVRVIEVESGRVLHSLHYTRPGLPNLITLSPDDRHAAARVSGNRLAVWELATWRVVMPIPVRAGHAHSATFSPDGSRLVIMTTDPRSNHTRVRVIRVPSGEELCSFEEPWQVTRPIAVSPQNDRLAAAGTDKTVRVWDAATGRTIWTFRGHTNQVQEVVFSPCGTRLASVGWDGTARVWDVSPFEE